jgi:hypothetical protein
MSSVVLRNAVALVLVWIVSLASVQFGQRIVGGWLGPNAFQTVAAIVGIGVALLLRAHVAALIVAGLAAFSMSELTIHLWYGIRSAQGAPTHFAVIGAGVLGVAMGSLLSSRTNHDGIGL